MALPSALSASSKPQGQHSDYQADALSACGLLTAGTLCKVLITIVLALQQAERGQVSATWRRSAIIKKL